MKKTIIIIAIACYTWTLFNVGKHTICLTAEEYETWHCDYWYACNIDEAYKGIMRIVSFLSPVPMPYPIGTILWAGMGFGLFNAKKEELTKWLLAGMTVCSIMLWGVTAYFGAFEEDVLRLHRQANIYPALSYTALTIFAYIYVFLKESK